MRIVYTPDHGSVENSLNVEPTRNVLTFSWLPWLLPSIWGCIGSHRNISLRALRTKGSLAVHSVRGVERSLYRAAAVFRRKSLVPRRYLRI
jgi:hypothetical protein